MRMRLLSIQRGSAGGLVRHKQLRATQLGSCADTTTCCEPRVAAGCRLRCHTRNMSRCFGMPQMVGCVIVLRLVLMCACQHATATASACPTTVHRRRKTAPPHANSHHRLHEAAAAFQMSLLLLIPQSGACPPPSSSPPPPHQHQTHRQLLSAGYQLPLLQPQPDAAYSAAACGQGPRRCYCYSCPCA